MKRYDLHEPLVADPGTWCDVGPWHEAHRWSPWRLFGLDIWRWACEDIAAYQFYVQRRNSKRVARENLEKLYGR